MTYKIRKSMTKMLECLGPASEHIWRSKLQGCWGMMPIRRSTEPSEAQSRTPHTT